MELYGWKQSQGTNTANNGATSGTVIAAPGVGKVLRLTNFVLTVTVAAVGGGGLVNIQDGTTTIMSFPADALNSWLFDFGERGYALSDNAALTVNVSGAATTQATARLTAVALVNG